MHFKKLILSFTTLISIDVLTAYAADKDEKPLLHRTQPMHQSNLLKVAKTVLEIANRCLNSEKYEAAAIEYEKAIAMLKDPSMPVIPNFSDLYEKAALCYFLSHDYLKAIDHYETAKNCVSVGARKNCQSYLTLATAYMNIEKHEQALENFTILFNLNKDPINNKVIPISADTYFAAAQSAMVLKEWNKSVELYNKGFDLAATPNVYAYANMGRAHLELKNYVTARSYLEQAIQLKPDLPQVVYERLHQAEANLKENK